MKYDRLLFKRQGWEMLILHDWDEICYFFTRLGLDMLFFEMAEIRQVAFKRMHNMCHLLDGWDKRCHFLNNWDEICYF